MNETMTAKEVSDRIMCATMIDLNTPVYVEARLESGEGLQLIPITKVESRTLNCERVLVLKTIEG